MTKVAAVVRRQEITVEEVEARLAALRAGPLAARLPHPGGAEGRNLRRWLVQVMAAELLVRQETGMIREDRQEYRECQEYRQESGATLSLALAMRTGGVVAAVLATPAGQALFDQVTAGIRADEAEIYDYYARNQDKYLLPETRWTVELGPLRRGELAGPIEDAVFAAVEGETVGPVEGPGGLWSLTVWRIEARRRMPYETVREKIAGELTRARRERMFGRWLEARQAAYVRLMPGFEHPGDPRHPDATHRH